MTDIKAVGSRGGGDAEKQPCLPLLEATSVYKSILKIAKLAEST